jgi:hypothetical protein
MKKDTYYASHRKERLEYQKKNPIFCSICSKSYTNKTSHFRNPKYEIKHQAALSASLRNISP